MKRTHLIAILASLVAIAIVAADASAMYNPRMGVFMQRDPGPGAASPMRIGAGGRAVSGSFAQRDPQPAGQYADGMNLYQYVSNRPTKLLDPMGLWGKDFHHDLTLELAKRAGIACPEQVAEGCQGPDEGLRSAPEAFVTAGILRMWADWKGDDDPEKARLERRAAFLISRAQALHFPADKDGVVRPDSRVANAKVDKGIKDCNFRLFTEGLHTLQDSWAHQGEPFMLGLGHARGAEQVDGQWRRLSGLRAARSHSADDVTIWPEDARAAAVASYRKMLEFKKA